MTFPRLGTGTDSSDRLEEVFQVATKLIARDGFEKASMRAIAGEIGMSQAGLYHYFKSKDELLYLIQKHTFTTLRNSLAARLDPNSPPKERLRVMIHNHLEFFLVQMDALRVCAYELNKLGSKHYEEVQAIRQDYFRIAHSIVGEVLSEQNRSSVLGEKRTTLFIFGALNWIHMWFDTERPLEIESISEELSEMVLHGLTGKTFANGEQLQYEISDQ
jgi:TetR/AcrR family transcriptional regulator